jgi:hypothetical protein
MMPQHRAQQVAEDSEDVPEVPPAKVSQSRLTLKVQFSEKESSSRKGAEVTLHFQGGL